MFANKDIIFNEGMQDFKLEATNKYQANNICSIQLRELVGGPDIGIDFSKFVKGELEFSMKTFKSHILEQLTSLGVTVSKVDVEQNDLAGTLNIGVA